MTQRWILWASSTTESARLDLESTRCAVPYWSLTSELFRDETATTIAAAFLPDKEYEKAFFTDGPRRILAHLLKYKSDSSNLLKLMSDHDQIASRVKGTPLAAFIDPNAPGAAGRCDLKLEYGCRQLGAAPWI